MTAIHDPRSLLVLAVPAALAAAAIGATVVAGGVPGFVLGFAAALVAVDRLLDLGGSTAVGAEQAFKRLGGEVQPSERIVSVAHSTAS